MSSFNDALKDIWLGNLAIFIVVSYIILSVLGNVTDLDVMNWFYVIVIFYFIFLLRGNLQDFKQDARNVLSKIDLKQILVIVFLNILFSYGMLYLSGAIIDCFPFVSFFAGPSKSLVDYVPVMGSFAATVVISPISEELIFRGVFLNRLKLYVPTVFAIFVSSLLFGALHSFGSMISAVVFAVCMAILYLKTDNICVPILAHFLNNLFAEIIRLADFNNVLFTNELVMTVVGILAVISAILLVISIGNELNKC